jgi:hypothetical protein
MKHEAARDLERGERGEKVAVFRVAQAVPCASGHVPPRGLPE